jgi:hypothetical protein
MDAKNMSIPKIRSTHPETVCPFPNLSPHSDRGIPAIKSFDIWKHIIVGFRKLSMKIFKYFSIRLFFLQFIIDWGV